MVCVEFRSSSPVLCLWSMGTSSMSSSGTAEEARIVVVADIMENSRLAQRQPANIAFVHSWSIP